VKIKTSIPGL